MNERERYRHYLQELAKSIDISNAQKEEAYKRYKTVAEWLGEEPSTLSQYAPDIYPQGSFALGTVVRPLGREEEFDLDLVVELELTENQVTQERLKAMVGDRLKEHGTFKQMLNEKNRCWQLQYSDGAQFHMDILPGIPEQDRRILAEAQGLQFGNSSILIPDKQLKGWKFTNPRGYQEWFKAQMKQILAERRAMMAMEARVDVAEVPEYKVMTPLQRSIQILKRHSDIMFSDDDNKPISIIITTLAAEHYDGQKDIVEALNAIIDGIIGDPRLESGAIKNPIDERENFADKWQENPELQDAFVDWINQAGKIVQSLQRSDDLDILKESAGKHFGSRTANDAARMVSTVSVASSKEPDVGVRNVEIKEKPAQPWQQ